ncbi:NAD(P)/FAD-dependent oxidoreductase [Cobetia sp. L2A1]|uniref:NAD(P)/FAD-dependent oxidoreductase n=1 Tax=Cobetia sp. L2A1 TaxID=2686360 RepID=UPI00131CF37F|nr:FAD-dependent oxidoreductase [Cobetia sp. L2A1]
MDKQSLISTPGARIVIVGGGAGGLELAVRLARAGHDDVVLVDRQTTHVWKPRLHEVAAGLGRRHVDALGYAGLAETWGFRFECGTLESIDVEHQQITLASIHGPISECSIDGQSRALPQDTRIEVPSRVLDYRQLVLALGGVTPDMGVEGVLEHACLLDTPEDAERIAERYSRGLLAHHVRHGMSVCETAGETDESTQAAVNTPYRVVIVGSGATGVELAAYLASGAHSALEAPAHGDNEVEITILEATETFMPGVSETLREAIHQRLVAAGIRIELSCQVSAVTPDQVKTAAQEGDETSESIFASDLVIWAAGRVGPPIVERIEALASNKKRQWSVTNGLQCLEQDAIFALGDCSCIENSPVPPTAQVASEQAEFLAEELPRRLKGEAPREFVFDDKGTLLSLGAAGSVGELTGKLTDRFSGQGHDDLQVRGRFARAAYHGLQRQHQFVLLGPVKGTAEAVSDAFRRTLSPRLKVH